MDSSSDKRIISEGSSSSNTKKSMGSKQQQEDDANQGTVLYVGNVPLSITAYELRQLFEFFGAIDDVKLGTDDGRNRVDYALIRFAHIQNAMAAQVWNNCYEIQGHVLKVCVTKKNKIS